MSKAKLIPRKLKEFETALKKADAAKTLAKPATQESLLEAFNDSIEPDPEEEFHRAIQRLGVQYTCSFEESEDKTEDKSGGPSR